MSYLFQNENNKIMGVTDFVSEERALEKCHICHKLATITRHSFIEIN